MTGPGDKPVDADLSALERLGFKLDPWQRRLLAAIPDPGVAFLPPSRAQLSGKVAYQREAIRRALEAGQHVHVVTTDPRGIECPGGQCTPDQLQRSALKGRGGWEPEAWRRGVVDEWSDVGVSPADWRRANPPLRSVDGGGWEPAQPIPVRGLVGRLEAAALRRGWTRLATWLGNFDERNLGK